jgi:hypothetical protein
VYADDREIFAEPDLRADGSPPSAIDLSVAGVRRLRLAIDFGADQDSGDRVVWADARLVRAVASPPR